MINDIKLLRPLKVSSVKLELRCRTDNIASTHIADNYQRTVTYRWLIFLHDESCLNGFTLRDRYDRSIKQYFHCNLPRDDIRLSGDLTSLLESLVACFVVSDACIWRRYTTSLRFSPPADTVENNQNVCTKVFRFGNRHRDIRNWWTKFRTFIEKFNLHAASINSVHAPLTRDSKRRRDQRMISERIYGI